MPPTIWDLFNNRAFRGAEVTATLENLTPRPTTLGALGLNLFQRRNVRFRTVVIVKRNRALTLVPTSPIGSAPVELEKVGGDARPFFTRRIAKGSTVYAEELQGLLVLPELDRTLSLQQEIADRGVQIVDDIELTKEHMRLGAIQGRVLDADGSTLDDWFANWGISQAAPYNLHLNQEVAGLRLICDTIREDMWQDSDGSWIDGQTTVHALAGSELYRALITHPEVVETYKATPQAQQLRAGLPDTFEFGEITWHRFRQPRTASDFSIAPDQASFFPVGGNNIFQEIFGPGEFDPYVNQPGRDIIGINIPDRDRGAWTRVEAYNYPLYACTRPAMLKKAVKQ